MWAYKLRRNGKKYTFVAQVTEETLPNKNQISKYKMYSNGTNFKLTIEFA